MVASICICTLDRALDLKRALSSLAKSQGIEKCEIIVVNNSSTENSKSVIEKFKNNIRIRYFRVDGRSLGRARNKGWREARSATVAYLDDDAYVCSSWVPALLSFAEDPKVAGQTGRVCSDPPLSQLSQNFHPSVCAAAYSLLDLGPVERDLRDGESVIGNNMAFKRNVLLASGGFAENLRTYDEPFLVWPLMWKGERFRYNPAMAAVHCISQARQSHCWIRQKVALSGVSYQILLTHLKDYPQSPGNSDILARSLRAAGGWIVSLLLSRRKHQFAFECELLFCYNRLLFLLRMHTSSDYD
jgi:glycosyltransferase involved in cell wall biosynthesis